MVATEDLFTPIHKALRAMIYSLSSRLQTNDFTDLSATTTLVTDLENDFAMARSAGCVLCIMAHHAVDEETAIFPSVAESENQLIASLIADHHELARREEAITKAGHELIAMTSPELRSELGILLNQTSNALFAAYLTHMNREETELVPRMKEKFTDAEMAAMQRAITSQMPPDRMMSILGWMLPSLNGRELASLLTALSKGAPPPVIAAIVDLGSKKVEPSRWKAARLRAGI